MIRRPIAWVAAAVLTGALGSSALATIRYVDDAVKDPFECQGAQYSSISAALAVSQEGDDVRVCPGVYPEQLVITHQIRLSGVSFGTARPVITPTALPETRVSTLGGNPIAAAILVDAEAVRIENIDVDLAQNTTPAACSPLLAGIYLRNTSGIVDGVTVDNAVVPGRPDCDSGVGLYIESGIIGEVLGEPVIGTARVSVRNSEFHGYQKAGLVANGLRAVITIKGGEAIGLGATDGAVQIGYQIGLGAKAKLSKVVTGGHASTIANLAAAGILVYQSDRASIRRVTATDSEEGVIVLGSRARVKKGTFSTLTGDGVVFFGDANLASGNLIEQASVSGAFVKGERNTIRGGVIRDMNIGVWFQDGFGNRLASIKFENVPLAGQGISGGVRADLTEDSLVPFTAACETVLECDDGNDCTTDACSVDGACSSTAVLDGTACATGTCTAGVCS